MSTCKAIVRAIARHEEKTFYNSSFTLEEILISASEISHRGITNNETTLDNSMDTL